MYFIFQGIMESFLDFHVQFLGAGVCKISTKGVHLHPLLLCREALFHAAFKAYSLNDRQGGARGCIVRLYQYQG